MKIERIVRGNMHKAWFLKVVIIFLSSFFLFAVAEFSLRIFFKNELRNVRTTLSLLQERLWTLPPLFIENQKGQYETNVAGVGGLDRVQLQRFDMPKKKGRYRIFCIGESSVQGFPYLGGKGQPAPKEPFPAQLQQMLDNDFNNIEVINAGIGAVSSSQLIPIVKELTRYEPDGIILYSGHNEYGYYFWQPEVLRVPAWQLKVSQKLEPWYIYRFICKMTRRAASVDNENSDKWFKYMPGPLTTNTELHSLLNKSFKNIIPPREWEKFSRKELLLSALSFEKSLSEMRSVLKDKKIRFMICTIVSNLKDFPPFFSFHSPGLSNRDLLRWNRLYETAQRPLADIDLAPALLELKQLEALDEEYAETHYLLGKVYYRLRDYDEARKHFILARDLSPAYAPFQRAPSSLNELIRKFAHQEDVPLADIEQGFYSLKDNFGIPGNDLFFDGLHPNEKGYKLIAALIAQAIKRDKWIPSPR